MTGSAEHISKADIERIKASISIYALVNESTELKRIGGTVKGLCPFHSEKTPSFTVNDQKRFYHCFGCGEHGDVIEWVQKRFNMDFNAATQYLAERAGIVKPRGAEAPKPLPAAPKRDEQAEQKNVSNVIAWCQGEWRKALAANDTAVADYLRERGIDLARIGGVPPSLRYAVLYHKESNQSLPAMVGAVQAVDRSIVGIHRTYLQYVDGACDQEASAVNGFNSSKRVVTRRVVKADVNPPKKMAGPCSGGAVRLAPAAPTLAIAEGIETALAVMMATGIPCWAALSMGNLATIQLPDEVSEVIICADNDAKDPKAADKVLRGALNAHVIAGRKVRLAKPPLTMDFNDLLWRD